MQCKSPRAVTDGPLWHFVPRFARNGGKWLVNANKPANFGLPGTMADPWVGTKGAGQERMGMVG